MGQLCNLTRARKAERPGPDYNTTYYLEASTIIALLPAPFVWSRDESGERN